MKPRLNDEDRRLWILNDEGLYNLQRTSGQSMKRWIRENRVFVDEVITNVLTGKKQAHYLVYG